MTQIINSQVRVTESYDASEAVHKFAMLRWDTSTLAWVKFSGAAGGIAADVTITNFPSTQAISAASLPLPSGASTSAKQDTLLAAIATAAKQDIGNTALSDIKTLLARGATPTVTAVASSASTGTLLAANSSRLRARAYNHGTKLLYLKEGSGANIQAPSEDVVWQNVNANCAAVGKILTRNAASGWDGGARSTQVIATANDGYVEYTVDDGSAYIFCGLSHSNPDDGFASIKWSVDSNAGAAGIYELGVLVHSFSVASEALITGDVVRISKESGAIKYYKNGVFIYTSLVAPSALDLFVDCSIYSQNATLAPSINTNNAANSFTIVIQPQGFYDIQGYTGIVTGLWDAANGYAMMTEITA